MITADNQRIYYGGSVDKNVLIWHDDEELLEIIRDSTDLRAANVCPMEVVFIEYDTIQEITLLPGKKDFIDYIKSIKGDMGDKDFTYALNMVTSYNEVRQYKYKD